MRNYTLALAAACVLHPAFAVAVTPQGAAAPPAAQGAKTPEKKEIKVPAKVLKTYVGEYEFGPERTLTITLEGGSLWGQPTGQEKRQLFAESQTKFFLKDLPVVMSFEKDAKGVVTGMVMDQEGRPQRKSKKLK
jgi:hypothetical protein